MSTTAKKTTPTAKRTTAKKTTTAVPASVAKPTDHAPKKAKEKTVTFEVHGVEITIAPSAFNDADLAYISSLDDDEFDIEDMQLAITVARRMIGKDNYRAILTALRKENGGKAPSEAASIILVDVMSAAAPLIEDLGN